MTLKAILAGTAIASLALVCGVGAPAGMPFATQAEAAVNISISVFYDSLASHGDWVRYHDAYVFVPAGLAADWQPYTVGHWVYTERYGWTWASDEPFGWATYHYGRWGFAEDIGWYWVPGTRWAPAWVSWRKSKNYIVWAPLPPARGGTDVSVTVSVGDIPEFYWVAVPARRFLAPDIHVVVVHEDREVRRVIEHTEFIGAPQVTNNIVVNNMIDVNVVQKATGKKVRPVEVRETADPREATATAKEVTVFQGEVSADAAAKPKSVREPGDVKKAGSDGKAGKTEAAQPVPEPNSTTGSTTAAPPEAPADSGTAATPPAEQEKKKATSGETQPQDSTTADTPAPQPPAAETTQGTDTQPADTQTGQEPATDKATKDNGTKDKSSKDKGTQEKPAKAQDKGKDKKDQPCDPATDAACDTQQQ